jgi:prephenate dehydratase
MRDLRALPVPQRCYVLGPAGTFSEAGAQLYARAFAASGLLAPAIAYTASIEDAIATLAQDPAAVAIVPIENSESGTVVVTQEELRVARVRIEWELAIDVRYNLIGQGPLERVRRVYCHPVAQGQCTRVQRTSWRRLAQLGALRHVSRDRSGSPSAGRVGELGAAGAGHPE